MADEEDEVKPKWKKPAKPQEPPKQEWVNPNTLSSRERMDQRLERAGLLNYQTQGLSQAEINARYANAGISVNGQSQWFRQNYGSDAPAELTWRTPAERTPNIFPELPANLPNPRSQPQINQPIQPIQPTQPSPTMESGNLQYYTLPNGMVVKSPKPAPVNQGNITSPYAASTFATMDQAQKGEANWTDVSSFERKQKLKDPNFYKSGEITKYPAWMQQQIMADPSFDWKQVPAWQKTYYELSSNPAGMGAAQGTLMGIAGGPVGGAVGGVLGGTLGYAAAKSGYDATKEFWEQDGLIAGGFGLMNWLAEQAEKTVGMGFQVANAAVDPKKNVMDVLNKDAWNAGAGFFEVITPAWIEAMNTGKGEIGADDLLKAVPGVWVLTKIGDVIAHPEKYKGEEVYLGAESPIQLDKSWIERIDAAREEIKAGRPYREVMMDMQTGVVAQLGDMAGQAAADPLNFMPDMSTKIAGKFAEASGNTVAATALNQSEGFVEAGRRYKNLVQTGQALTIDPNFKVDGMGRFSKWVAGINDQGQVKAGSLFGTKQGLLDPIKNKTGFLEDMVTQTPHSRAQTGAGLFYENISAMLQMFDDPAQAGKYLRALSNNDMNTWAELGSRFAESPEFYTVLPAIKDFSTSQLDGIVQAWEMTSGNRDLLTRVADVMGEGAGSLLEDLTKHGTAEQDFQRVVKRLRESDNPTAKALLSEVDAGTFTAETLKQMVDVFTGDGALPWHPGQWKAMMMDTLGSHFDKWVTQRLMLDKSPEAVSAFYRTSALMKQAQSILLLGGSPGYAITNGLSNMVHRAVSGLYGYMTPNQINGFMDRFGLTPARFDEGVGIGGQVEQAAGTSRVKTSEMDKAVKGKGPLTTAKDYLGKLSKGMPFSKLSSAFERMEGRQAFTIGMKDFWSQSWRRGVGFRKMTGEMEAAIRAMGQDPNVIYAAIESGMNQAEIEKAVFGRQAEVQARSLIHDAAAKTGMSASDAAQMLERIGVLDTLDTFLKGQTTPDGIRGAFRRAERAAQDFMDMRTGDDLKATAESVKQRVGLEGAAAALDVSMKAHGAYTDVWMDHYYRFGEVMNDLYTLPDRAQMDKAIDLAYEQSDVEFRRVDARNAANYKGIFDAWGMSGDPKALRMLEGMGEVGEAMGGAYRGMRENFRQWRQKWAGDLTNPARWDELEMVRAQNDRLFKQAFKAKHDAEVKQGAALGEVYESLYGAAAGEAARKWWEDMTAFNDEMVKKEQAFRQEINEARRTGATAEDIAAAKQKYYAETKILQIAELERINGEGIARLERVIKKGGGGGRVPVSGDPVPVGPVDGGQSVTSQPTVSPETAGLDTATPTRPAGDGVDEVNALMAAAEQRKGKDKADADSRKAAGWDVAEEYWGKGGNYSRGILQDGFALVNALRKPEYGGIPDLTWLDDPRLTPELAREILERRKAAKETSAAAAAEQAFTVTEQKRGRKFDTSQINEDTSILRAIALHGGIDLSLAKDLTGEVKPKSAPGVFTRKGATKGYGIDEMARLLADDGYPIRLDDPNDPGGIQQTTDLINKARAGDKVYPMGHSFDAEINAAEQAWIEGFNLDEVPEVPFDSALWQTEFDNAVQFADLGKVYELIGNFPDEMLDTPVTSSQLSVTSGGTWREFLSRVADDVAVRVTEDAVTEKVAGHAARAEESIRAAELRAEASSKRTVLMESLAEAFGLSDEQAKAYGDLSDAVAGWYARMTGETADDFYNRYFGDVRRSDQGTVTSDQSLMQDAFHGSPYKFDKFTLDKIGAGEGNQAYGWGLYFAGDKSVAEYYRQKLAGNSNQPPQRFYKGKALEPGTPEYHAATLLSRTDRTRTVSSARKEVAGWIKEYQEKVEGYKGSADPNAPRLIQETEKLIGDWQKTLDLLNEATSKKDFTEKPNAGQLYKVELPDENYLLWDKPLSEQPEGVRQAIKKAYDNPPKGMSAYDWKSALTKAEYLDAVTENGNGGLDTYKAISNLLGGDKQASLYLKELGINGIQYLDGSSRGKGEGNYNYVIFDDAAVQIKETFYQREQQGGLFGTKEPSLAPMVNRHGAGSTVEVKLDGSILGMDKITYNITNDVPMKSGERVLTTEIYQQKKKRTTDIYRVSVIELADGNLTSLVELKQELSGSPSGVDVRFDKAPSDFMDKLDQPVNKFARRLFDEQVKMKGQGTFDPTPSPSPSKSIDGEGSRAIPGAFDKGMVTFEGLKGTITAFEKGDFSTVVHESGHIYRRMLADVAERTQNPYIMRDLKTVEEWAGVKDGKWDRAAEEKFARGFEKYLADGKAPTPALVRAFEQFKSWMLEIYKMISGSQIDVKLTDDVRRVFDRMLGAENMRVELDNILLQMNYDPRIWYVDPTGAIVKRPKFELNVDKTKAMEQVEAMDIEGMQARAAALRERMNRGEVQALPDDGTVGFWEQTGRLSDAPKGSYREGWRSWSSFEEPPVKVDAVRELSQWTKGRMDEGRRQRAEGAGVNQLFQKAEPVETPEFKRWFGDSKVVDESGKPLVVYHGTKADIQIFSKKKAGVSDPGLVGKAFYFTPSPEQAGDFATNKYYGKGNQPNVMPVYMRIENPYTIKDGVLPDGRRLTEVYPQGIEKNAAAALQKEIKKLGHDGVIFTLDGEVSQIAAFEPTQIKSVANRGTFDPGDPNILFQSEQPFGRYDEASQFRAESEGLDEGWREKVRPLLNAMEEGAVQRAPMGEGAALDTSAEGQAMLRKYMRQVQNEMATTKLATVRHAERQRDFALLNYSKRYGFDRMAESVMPYQFYTSRSMFTWAGRALDKPALYSNYARLRMQQERYEKDVPERLRGKIRIPAPWLPEWAGDGLYIDPFRNLFFPENVVRYFERAKQEKTYQQIEAERVLQEWQADGKYSDAEILSAVQSQKGKVWERAQEEAALRRESESANPVDFFTGFFGPAWYLSTPLNLAGIKVPGISKGDPNKVGTTPLGNTSRALDTVTQGTWAEPLGDVFGLIGKAEDWGREKFNLPTHGEYAEYYTKRQVANMVADGLISAEEAQMAMIEKSGPIWDQAVERVDMELALRVPLAGVTYAALNEGLTGAAQAALPSMFGASLLPAGELEFRGLKQEWNEAWKLADAGDDTAVRTFFEEHPEYEAWLAKGKKDDELLQSFLVGQVWDTYMELGTTNQKQARAELGELFQQAFLDKETRSYESIPVDQLAEWSRLLGGLVPKTPGLDTPAANTQATRPAESTLRLYPESVTAITDQYFAQRTEKFPNYYEEQSGYYALPKSARAAYLLEHPNLKKYWEWKKKWESAYPEYKPIFKGDAFDRVDTSGWMPGLEDIVRETAYMGGNLPSGARAALMNVWLMEGQPMGEFDTWVKSVVMPGMIYGGD